LAMSEHVVKIISTDGTKAEVKDRHGARPPKPRPGEHLWIMIGMWRITDPARTKAAGERVLLDGENLLTVEGPGCFVCEQSWSPEVEAKRCPGDPSGVTR